MASSNDDTNTVAGTAGVVGGAVGASHLLYREKGLAGKQTEALQRVAAAHKALDEKLAAGAQHIEYTGAAEGHKIAFNNARTSYLKTLENYEKAPALEQSFIKPNLEKAQQNYSKAAENWLSDVKKVAPKEVAEVQSAEKLSTSLGRLESANAKEGVYNALKRPLTVLRHGSTKAKLAIIASAAAIGAIAYGVSKAISSHERRDTSFADRVQQEQMAAAMNNGAAPARS